MLRLAQRRAARWPDVRVTLLDRLNLVAPQHARRPAPGRLDAARRGDGCVRLAGKTRRHALGCRLRQSVHASLFVSRAGASAAGNRGAHVACSSAASPGAPPLALAGSHVVGLLGAGPVTRRDAVSSVHAGFRAQELSDLWPDPQDWVRGRVSGGLVQPLFPCHPERAVNDEPTTTRSLSAAAPPAPRPPCSWRRPDGGLPSSRRRSSRGAKCVESSFPKRPGRCCGSWALPVRCWKSPDRRCAASPSTPATRW